MPIAIDTGGTFTDLVASVGPETIRLKVLSTPDQPERAVQAALDALRRRIGPWAQPVEVRHGSTVATNAILEYRGARVALITNAGFEDILLLRRQNRPELYALHPELPPTLIPSEQVVGLRGRLDPEGREVEPVEDLDAWVAHHRVLFESCEAYAVCLLHSYADGRHEQAVEKILEREFPGRPISISHRLAPVQREYERACTVAVNAYVAPIMRGYLRRLRAAIAPDRLAVMGSAGGLLPAGHAELAPVHTVLSGPAGGVRGAWAAGLRCGRRSLLTLDMGGTSADVSLLAGELVPEDQGELAQHPLRIPLLPIETVGAGGGSVAYVDEGGALQVGPRSAGAVPGPAAYGRAGPEAEPTVTDANVVLGRLPQLLGGKFPLFPEKARDAVARLASRLGASVDETALAVIMTAEATMARACKRVSMERGHDPRELTLLAFGGAAGLHACALADELGCRDVLFPREPGVLSAEGILAAPSEAAAACSPFLTSAEPRSLRGKGQNQTPRRWVDGEADDAAGSVGRRGGQRRQRPASASLMKGLSPQSPRSLAEIAGELRSRAVAELGAQPDEEQIFADCRYLGQSFSLAVPFVASWEELRTSFDRLHHKRYGYSLGSDRVMELVSVRLFVRHHRATEPCRAEEVEEECREGPRSICCYSSTLWLPAHWRARRLPTGDWLCERNPGLARETSALRPFLRLEIHRQRMAAVAMEMGATLMRAAFSANIKERRDYSCAVFDREGRMLVHAAHIPVHLGSTPLSVRAAIERVDMLPGDQVMSNDPYCGGTHLPDVTVVAPVFGLEKKRALFYVANRAHHADVGGISPGSLPVSGGEHRLTIDDEGFRIGPTRLDDRLRERFSRASRTPRDRLGDLSAQEAANLVGAERLRGLAEELGEEGLSALNSQLLDYSERRMTRVISELPDGAYHFTDFLDDDGAGGGPVAVPVTISIDGDQAKVDFREARDHLPGSLNSVRAIAISAVFYVFRCLGGDEIPANEGLLRPITVLTRPGSFLDARSPAAVSAGNVETSQRLVDALFGALAQVCPQMPAASAGSMNNVLFGGIDRRPGPCYGRSFVHYETLAGGAGASRLGRGASGIHTHMTNTLNTPVEALEREYPVRIERYALRPLQEARLGELPGGRGVQRRYLFLDPVQLTLVTERRRIPPWGLHGASPGSLGENCLVLVDGEEQGLPGKVTLHVEPGQSLIIRTPGGGGFLVVQED